MLHLKLTRVITFFALLITINLCSATGLTQNKKEKPNFTGLWKINNNLTTFQGKWAEISDRFQFEVVHEGATFKLLTRLEEDGVYVLKNERTYYTDGRGETNGKEVSTTTWNGKSLVTKLELKNTAETDRKSTKIEWTMSKDGKRMVESESSRLEIVSHLKQRGRSKKVTVRRTVEGYKFTYDRIDPTPTPSEKLR